MMKHILIEKKGRVMTIIMNRPEVRNAVNRQTADELAEAFREFEADPDSFVAVLWGNGGHFSAGADLKSMGEPESVNRLDETGDAPLGPTRMVLSKPVIAAISGYAVAGGLELALFCDLRVMEKSAVMGVFCRRWGVPLIDGGTVRLPRLIGLSRAMDLILTGRPVEAEEACAMGLANRIVEDGTARIRAEELAAQIAAFPQTCMRNDRLSAIGQFDLSFEDAMKNEFAYGLKSVNSPEIFEGVGRFTQGGGRHGSFG
jgi:enoyl-CoA hydratase